MIKSGSHLNVIRTWIQRNADRGEYLKWGSDEVVKIRRPMSMRDYEVLTQKIANAATRDILNELDICSSFESECFLTGEGSFHVCGHCGMTQKLHDLSEDLLI